MGAVSLGARREPVAPDRERSAPRSGRVVEWHFRRSRIRGVSGSPRSSDPSPDGEYILVETIHRPYSYLVPTYRFPKRIEVWDTAGKVVHQIADRSCHFHQLIFRKIVSHQLFNQFNLRLIDFFCYAWICFFFIIWQKIFFDGFDTHFPCNHHFGFWF